MQKNVIEEDGVQSFVLQAVRKLVGRLIICASCKCRVPLQPKLVWIIWGGLEGGVQVCSDRE